MERQKTMFMGEIKLARATIDMRDASLEERPMDDGEQQAA